MLVLLLVMVEQSIYCPLLFMTLQSWFYVPRSVYIEVMVVAVHFNPSLLAISLDIFLTIWLLILLDIPTTGLTSVVTCMQVDYNSEPLHLYKIIVGSRTNYFILLVYPDPFLWSLITSSNRQSFLPSIHPLYILVFLTMLPASHAKFPPTSLPYHTHPPCTRPHYLPSLLLFLFPLLMDALPVSAQRRKSGGGERESSTSSLSVLPLPLYSFYPDLFITLYLIQYTPLDLHSSILSSTLSWISCPVYPLHPFSSCSLYHASIIILSFISPCHCLLPDPDSRSFHPWTLPY